MTQPAHTPLQWEILHQCNIFSGRRLVANCAGHSNNTKPDGGQGENEANAALIVKAVNCHAELVAFIESIVGKPNEDIRGTHILPSKIQEGLVILAKAGAE